jgi:secretion/DNA translocation related CpaE-like protein
VLVATGEPSLAGALSEVASVAGVEPELAADPVALRRRWAAASLVLLGADLAPGAGALPRRPGVVLVGQERDGQDAEAALWEWAVQLGVDQVAVLPDARSWLVDQVARTEQAPAWAPVVAIVGGRGGAGASSLAAALSLTAARAGQPVALVDLDPLGGGIDVLMAGEDMPGARWPDLAHARGHLPVRPLLAALPVIAGVHVLSWARVTDTPDDPGPAPETVACVVDALRRGTSLVVLDVPRHADARVSAALTQVGLAVLLVPAEVRAAGAAAQVAAWLTRQVGDVALLVRGPSPSGLPAEVIADLVGLPLLGWLPGEAGLAEALDRGDRPAQTGRGPLARACRDLLVRLGVLSVQGAAA